MANGYLKMMILPLIWAPMIFVFANTDLLVEKVLVTQQQHTHQRLVDSLCKRGAAQYM